MNARDPRLLARGAAEDLVQVYRDCRNANWDGYGALPVSEATCSVAQQLLKALPLGTPGPSVGAEPDGHITLEWHRSSRRTLSVSVGPDGELHYAALLETSEAYGTAAFCEDVPKAILDLIDRTMAA